jgi:hypothetical protein
VEFAGRLRTEQESEGWTAPRRTQPTAVHLGAVVGDVARASLPVNDSAPSATVACLARCVGVTDRLSRSSATEKTTETTVGRCHRRALKRGGSDDGFGLSGDLFEISVASD